MVATRSNGDRLGRQLAIAVALVLAPVVYALIVNLNALDNPPAWDSAVTVSPAAIAIVESELNIWEVAQLPSSPEGGPSTHATSIYTMGLAVLISLFGGASAFYVAHFFSIALIGGLSTGTYLLARLRASILVSALAAMTVSTLPLVIQQASDIYLDLPLAVVTTFACWTACRRWFGWTAGLILLGIAVKTSGVFLLLLLPFAKPIDKSLRRHLMHTAVAGMIAAAPFLLATATTHRFAGGTRSPLTTWPLLVSSASMLALTTDIFLVLVVYVVVTYARARSGHIDRATVASLIVTGGFFAAHTATMLLSGTIAMLPRYYIAIVPTVVVALLPLERAQGRQWSPSYLAGVGFVVALAVFSLFNLRGDFYPQPNHDFYVITERSTRAQQLLELQIRGTRELVSTGLPLLVERQVYFQLEYPAMGYVEETPAQVIPVFFEPVEELPKEFAMLMERRFANPLVPIEARAIEHGYTLEYEKLSEGPFQSELIIASRCNSPTSVPEP